MQVLALLLVLTAPLHAAVIGMSKPAESITAARIAQLPAAQQPAWAVYLERSRRQEQTDRAALAAERVGLQEIPPLPQESGSAHSIPLGRDAGFYQSAEARRIADTIVSFQIPNGGWSKNLNMAGPSRLRGQSWAPDNLNRHPSPDDFDTPRDPQWNYMGTLDNDATNTELRYLARVAGANPGPVGAAYRTAFLKGVDYLLQAQFPNGGWPQVWPLEGGYHDAITFNDNAVTESAELLSAAAAGKGDYAFVPAQVRQRAATAAGRALDCILKAQIVLGGKLTIWPQQADALTLAPTTARNYEPAALATGESADLLLYLMAQPVKTPATEAAIRAGVAWLEAHAIRNMSWTGGRDTPDGRRLVASPGAGPLWARYYSLETQQPVFGDRDKTIHDTVDELSLERRNGYAWYSAGPKEAIERYRAR
ncbi:pectate lyase, PelA/Pel-15E family [Granulicella rosea]|uniref:Pectate lyase, PelA/Pel-15E family n=1 Tax=Granulicella rosea TaxID=474952 RepID=A0A239JUC3_9BACT|nr:pectate lyase [Granulicella rosea]SNT09385.1 pectate lyase, PelA/Pel-15E family [Granulicella rosea]